MRTPYLYLVLTSVLGELVTEDCICICCVFVVSNFAFFHTFCVNVARCTLDMEAERNALGN